MIAWDEEKRLLVIKKRNIDFVQLTELMSSPYLEDQKSDDPEQYRIIGDVQGRLLTFIVEYDEDELGELIWVVTGWESTQQERKVYEQQIKSLSEETKPRPKNSKSDKRS